MSAGLSAPPAAAVYRYHLLRAALDLFQCNLAALAPDQWPAVRRRATQSFVLEERVLVTDEARAIAIPSTRIDQAVAAVRARYTSETEFMADLAANGLALATVRAALARELLFDAVLQAVGARHAPVRAADEERFYGQYRARFVVAERRVARHLLITINEAFIENRRAAAHARIAALAEDAARGDVAHFAALARRHSECPTALGGGRLGAVGRGQLYPALEAALFALPVGQVSAVIESPLGFHLLWCERIDPERTLDLDQARAGIRAALTAQRRRACQQAWLDMVRGIAHETSSGESLPAAGADART